MVNSNRLKINRIKELVAEKSGLLKEIDTLNHINRSMAATIDAFRADAFKTTSKENVAKLESEIKSLRHRIVEANSAKLDLKAENERMKEWMSTYSKKVLKEHNYCD